MYTQTVTSGRLDRQGQIPAEKELRTYEVFHLGGRPVGRLLRKNGQALDEAERRREEERVNRAVREYERQRLSGRREQEKRPTIDVALVQIPVQWFPAYLRKSEFSNIRREQPRGRSALVVDFQPQRGEPTKGPVGFSSRTAGTLWIDEASQYAVRIEAYFIDDDDHIVQGSSMRMERTLVNDELWLPSRDERNLRTTYPLGTWTSALTVQYADYKKFSVESKVTVPEAGR